MSSTKRCSKCKKMKPSEEFYKRQHKCIVCYREHKQMVEDAKRKPYYVLHDPLPVDMGGYERGASFGSEEMRQMLLKGGISLGAVLQRGKLHYKVLGKLKTITAEEEADEGDY